MTTFTITKRTSTKEIAEEIVTISEAAGVDHKKKVDQVTIKLDELLNGYLQHIHSQADQRPG